MSERRFALRVGVIVPASNTNLEPDVICLLPARVCAHFQRIGDYPVDSVPDLAQLRALATLDLQQRVAELASANVDVFAYGCTSASFAMGSEFDAGLAAQIAEWSSKPAVTAAGALVGAAEVLGVTRVALATPYEAAVQRAAIDFLRERGLTVVGDALPERPLTNLEQGALGPEDVKSLARRADRDTAEAIVLSCTDMRSIEAADELERELGKPVITSNQALVWAALQRLEAGADMRPCGPLPPRAQQTSSATTLSAT